MKRFNLILILIAILFLSYVDDDCGAYFTSPQSFEFEIADKTSGENLITNGT